MGCTVTHVAQCVGSMERVLIAVDHAKIAGSVITEVAYLRGHRATAGKRVVQSTFENALRYVVVVAHSNGPIILPKNPVSAVVYTWA